MTIPDPDTTTGGDHDDEAEAQDAPSTPTGDAAEPSPAESAMAQPLYPS